MREANARLYDPALGRFLSPDPYVQMPGFTQNFNRYSYCLNNPLIYVDENGEFIGTIYTSFLGLGKALIKGVILPWFVGFDDPAKAGRMFNNAWTDYGKEVKNAFWIDVGKYIPGSKKTIAGKAWEVISRFTWQGSQTDLGNTYTHVRNFLGNVDRVDYFDGAIFATNENSKKYNGVTIGNYINMNIKGKIDHDFKTFITKYDPMYMHEYGHYIDSPIYGLSYLFVIGLPSLFSAQFSGYVYNTYDDNRFRQNEHDFRWYERSANKRAAKYFEKYGVNWDTDIYDKYTFELLYPRKDRR